MPDHNRVPGAVQFDSAAAPAMAGECLRTLTEGER